MSGFTFKNLLGHYAKIFKCYDVAVKDCHQRLIGAFSVILKLETSRRFVSSSSKQITAIPGTQPPAEHHSHLNLGDSEEKNDTKR